MNASDQITNPHGLFNAGLEAKATRAIDIHEKDRLDTAALQELIRAAVALNGGNSTSPPKSARAKRR
jgi:hypothetical protein